MKHLRIECVGGASGDMMLGALVELGAPLDELTTALKQLGTAPFKLELTHAESMGITGVRMRVEIEGQEQAAQPAHAHDHTHDHAHHHHEPAEDGHHDHHHHHDHRSLSSIKELIARADLPGPVKSASLAVFQRLGEAEASIHGVPVDDIHFHEVGADDSILDIVGSCWALHALGVDSISVSPIPQGQGTIRCAHGVYPNPAPATLALTAGLPVTQTDEPFELVTPTGAALIATWRNAEAPPAGSVVKKIAYSMGQRKLHHRPNLLRASLYDVEDHAGETSDTALLLACNLDDTTPELVGALMDDVLAAGALDVTCAPVTMKKQRSGMVFSVLCHPGDRERMLDIIFRGSTTFGVRETPVRRTKLQRRFETVTTPFGEVRVKIGSWQGEDITRAPEMDDCRRLAAKAGVNPRAVYEAAARQGSRS